MQSLQQKVYIPANHQLKIQVPKDIPTGEAEILLVFQSKQKVQKQQEKRILGLYKNKGSFKLKSDFKMTEEEFLSL